VDRQKLTIQIDIEKSWWLNASAIRKEIEEHLEKLSMRLACGGTKITDVKIVQREEQFNG
jgi:hypothetical protein